MTIWGSWHLDTLPDPLQTSRAACPAPWWTSPGNKNNDNNDNSDNSDNSDNNLLDAVHAGQVAPGLDTPASLLRSRVTEQIMSPENILFNLPSI